MHWGGVKPCLGINLSVCAGLKMNREKRSDKNKNWFQGRKG